jgi:hypothetical protein
MSKFFFILYVGCVLIFSAFARAQDLSMPFTAMADKGQANVHVEGVAVDQENLELTIAGYLPNPCFAEPIASLEQDVNEPNVLIVRLKSPIPTKYCVSMIKDFATPVSLPELAQSQGTELSLEEKALYLIRVQGSAFEMPVMGSDLMRVPGFVFAM